MNNRRFKFVCLLLKIRLQTKNYKFLLCKFITEKEWKKYEGLRIVQ